jgi:chitinase
VNQAPEHSSSNLPGTNFAGHCAGGKYEDSNLLSECYTIKQGIPYCKERGVKILLSIGGVYNEAGSNYKVTTDDKGREFADFLYEAFGSYNEYSNTVRPFDSVDNDGNAVHAVVDGFDFDIEHDLRK